MAGIERGGGGMKEWRETGVRGKETLVSGLIIEVNWEESLRLSFNIPFLTEKVGILCTFH